MCETYWYPLYVFIRRKGFQFAEAQDLTQSFFAQLLEKDRLRVADPERGRFRSFLLASLNNFLSNWQREARAVKRGGAVSTISLDFESGESRYDVEPSNDLTPEKLFERRWAMTLLTNAVAKLREEYDKAGKLALFESLKGNLGGDTGRVPYKEIADQLGMSEGAIKIAAHRLRQRCRDILRGEISQTVATPEDIDEELRHLFAAVAN